MANKTGLGLSDALRALNEAAYAAMRVGGDPVQHPYLDRQKLREICRDTDRLVDDNTPGRKPAK